MDHTPYILQPLLFGFPGVVQSLPLITHTGVDILIDEDFLISLTPLFEVWSLGQYVVSGLLTPHRQQHDLPSPMVPSLW